MEIKILNPEKKDKQLKTSKTDYQGKSLKELDFKQTAFYPNPISKKQIGLDLRLRLSTGENINVEMQTIRQKYFLKRILFYWSKLYSQDLEKGEGYHKIHPAYSLIFTIFPVLDDRIKDFMSSFSIRRDKKPHELFNEDLKIVIVELSKLTKTYRELLDLKEMWCYILRESDKITKEEYKSLSKNEEIKVALRHLTKLSKKEELFQEALTEEINQVAYGLDRAGLLEEGMQKGQKEIALNMLKKNFEASFISEITGLSKEEINKLKL